MRKKRSPPYPAALTALVFILVSACFAGCSADKDEAVDYTGFHYSEGIDDNGFWKGVTAVNHIEMFSYNSLSVPSGVHTVSDDALQSAIDDFMAKYPEKIRDRAVADGDTVNIDFVGSVDGVEFSGGTTEGKGEDVTIGVTNYIDGFLEQLIGRVPGETFDVEATFPEEYSLDESLAGKDAIFVTTINYIVGDGVSELTDEFVETELFDEYGWKSVDEMKNDMRDDLRKSAVTNYVLEYLTTKVTVKSVPEAMKEYQEKYMLKYLQEYANLYGMEFNEFLSTYLYVESVEELIESEREGNLETVTYYLICQAVAEDAGISVSQKDIEEFFDSEDYSYYEELYGLPYFKQMILCEKVIDHIVANAVLE